ncbi:13521_t:CDS:2 [Acaulospora morrowiae]|uniref:13521_t:CDS:1 n=1 Tax=Acaulospora morrowiae TaxID=94023 RepID=A0A9N8ZA02_9GLOM|nr:13521_t:CDS:2 [Acaulospora morrowiae]
MIVNNTIPQWIDTWISRGEFDPSSFFYPGEKTSSLLAREKRTRFDQIKFDIVYTWVNGSDERHQKLREIYAPNKVKSSANSENRYRDYDELRYSIRSVEEFFGSFINKIFIIATDFKNTKIAEKDKESPSEVMQVPTWLNTSWRDCETGEPRVQMVRHSEIFTDTSVLPTFNSLAIESQMMNIQNLSDQVLYLNDDQFLGKSLSPVDFWTPLYGQVFHVEHHLTVPLEYYRSIDEAGEWYALYHSNKLLSKRFGSRHRPYVSHSTHTLSATILRSMVTEFPDEFLSTSSHRFRNIAPDLHTTFLFTHYVMEKHREALLRSFLVYKMDVNHNMKYELSERRAILKVFGNDGYTLGISRKTLENYEAILEKTGVGETRETKYTWSSMDGYAYSVLSPLHINYGNGGKKKPPYFFNPETHPPEVRSCKLELEYCFGSTFLSENENVTVDVESIFTEVAVRKVECGDCIIQHLIYKSGGKGLEAFLPSGEKNMTRDEGNSEGDSEDKNNVMDFDRMSYRTRAITEIFRYSYVIGGSSYRFIYMDYPLKTWDNLKSLSEQKPSIFCINDDVNLNNYDMGKIREYLSQFLRGYFSNATEYEIKDGSNGFWERVKRLLTV